MIMLKIIIICCSLLSFCLFLNPAAAFADSSVRISTPAALRHQQTILFKAPSTKALDFELFVKQFPHSLTYVNYQIEKISINERQEDKIFVLAELINQSPELAMRAINDLLVVEPLTTTSLLFLKDLSEKFLSRNLKPNETTYFKNLYCKGVGLVDDASFEDCIKTRMSFSDIHRQWPLVETVLIEGKPFSIENAGIQINSDSPQHWTLLSNSQKPAQFYGTYPQLIQQQLVMENLIEGNCQEFSDNSKDLDLLIRGVVFFDPQCSRPLRDPPVKSSFSAWFKDNKYWAFPVGLIVLGGTVLTLQNKVLVIQNPF